MKKKSIVFTLLVLISSTLCLGQSINMARNKKFAVASCNGRIFDHGGSAGDYLNNSSDTIVIYPNEPSKAIEIKLNSKAINQNGTQDGITFLGGVQLIQGGTTTTLTYISGYDLDGAPDYYQSTRSDGSVEFIFESYETSVDAGFDISFRCYDKSTITPVNFIVPNSGVASIETCSSTITDDGLNSNYFPSENGVLTIFPAENDKKVKLDFNSFDLMSGDNLKIYDGENTSSLLRADFSGSSIPSDVTASVVSTSGALTLKFTSNSSNQGAGFNLSSSCVNGPLGTVVPLSDNDSISNCSEIIYDAGGSNSSIPGISSNGSLTIYPTSPDSKVKVKITSLTQSNLENAIKVFDGVTINEALIGASSEASFVLNDTEFSASNLNESGAVTVQYIGDGSIPSQDFRISTSCFNETFVPVQGNKVITSCNQRFFDNGGSTRDYYNNADGSLTFESSTSNPVLLDVLSYEGLAGDSFSVYNGSTVNSPLLYSSIESTLTKKQFLANNVSNSLTVRHVTDGVSSNEGFEALISCYSPISSGVKIPVSGNSIVVTCDTLIYDAGGSLDYLSNANGSLTISPSGSDKFIKLLVDEIQLESNDSIFIYDGGDINAPLISSFSTLPTGITSFDATNTEGELTIRFQSDNLIEESGFRFDASCVSTPTEVIIPVNGSVQVTKCDTTISVATGADGKYFPNSDGSVTINPEFPELGQRIILDPNYLVTESGYDYIYVYDGVDVNAPLLLKRSGITSLDIVQATADNTSGALTVRFTSDSGTELNGIGFESSCYTPDGNVPRNGVDKVTKCEGRIYDSGGKDGNYEYGADGVLIVYPENSGDRVELEILAFETRSSTSGIISIYDGEGTSSATRLIEYGGASIPETQFAATNSSGALTIKFESDGWASHPGFEIQSSCSAIPDIAEISKTRTSENLTTCSSIIYDHGGENGDYENNADGTLTISPSVSGQSVELNIKSLSTFSNDYLRVYNGSSTNGTLLGEYSGFSISDSIITSTSSDGKLTLNFKSSLSGVSDGFKLTTSCVTTVPRSGNGSSVRKCDQLVYDYGGLSSNYSNNSDGKIVLHPEVYGQNLQVEILSLDIELGNDSLIIFDGTTDSSPKLISYSGETISDSMFTSTNGPLMIQFVSDDMNSSSGFKLKTSCVNPIIPQNGITLTDRCNLIVQDNGFDLDYKNNSDGLYTISPEDSCTNVEIEILNFDTELDQDILTIYNGIDTSSDEIVSLSGNNLGSLVFKADNDHGALTMRFVSNESVTKSGFEIKSTCGIKLSPESVAVPTTGTVTITTCDTTIYDIGGNCESYEDNSEGKLIVLPISNDSVVQFEVVFYSIEEGYDTLFIIDGANNGQYLDTLSGELETSSLSYTATDLSGALSLFFFSDYSATELGFHIKSSCVYRTPIVGIEEYEESSESVHLFPNPTDNDVVNISLPENETMKEVEAVNANGTIYSLKTKANTVLLNGLDKGVFSLIIKTDSSVYIEKLIKQ